MKILLSPAKSINFEIEVENPIQSQPIFLDKSEKLIKKLRKLSQSDISKLMKVSAAISELNYNRFQNWTVPFTKDNSKSAADIFTGAAYQGLDYPSFTSEDRVEGQDRLRILSGLYGVLKPLDLIQPYRLEMGTRFPTSEKATNLYHFWDSKIVDELNTELAKDTSQFLVNVASNEYFKAAKLENLKYPVVTPIFKDRSKTGEYKVIMTFAKKARGLMTKYIIQNRIESIEELKGFNYEGYEFQQNESNATEFMFFRG
jgi:cytoplasmic iron level regulating protein YaaA (DUF328/UPF0246 family)